MAQIIQIRRDTAANWTSTNPLLTQGEMGLESDTRKIKFGTGALNWNALPYFSGLSGTTVGGGATINFGASPGTDVVTLTVADVNVLTASKVFVFMSRESTAEHNEDEHSIAPIKFTVGNIVNGVSFDIVAVSDWTLDGTFLVNYLIII